MQRKTATCVVILLLAMTAGFAAGAETKIYKWVDANGNTHFGDKPQDPAQADKAKPVELTTGYRPPTRTPEEQKALEDEQRLNQEKSQAYQSKQRQQQEEQQEAQAKERQEKADLCAAYERDIQSLTTTEIIDGRRQRTYLAEDGKSVTLKRQQEIVEEVRAEMTAAGCQ